ncbi:hypothetical protein F5Y04DRAFT_290120 [Hypomontagnella monticulosa]|nr:hypothetical protein F5Y04DRAFT_290120 [Hypomontagnella monticulosa]
MEKINVYDSLVLPSQTNSIRLLKIDPGWPADPIQLEMFVVSDRKYTPPYQALSYVWGPRSDPVTIKCNSINIEITTNLASALRALRALPSEGNPEAHGILPLDSEDMLHSHRNAWKDIARNRNEADQIEGRRATAGSSPQFFWIDALCINQDDTWERAEQVKQMQEIYGTATKVRIHLGDEPVAPDGSALGLPEMKTNIVEKTLGRIRLSELGYMPVVLAFLAQARRNASRMPDPSDPGRIDTLRDIGFPQGDALEYQILASFFNQPWFHRVWTVQEAVLAREANITLGDWELDWKPFTDATGILFSASFTTSYSLSLRIQGIKSKTATQSIDISSALYLCDIQDHKRSKNLLPLLSDSRDRKATNPVDHVYAVLGMATEVQSPTTAPLLQQLLAVDYLKPASLVFQDATWFIILNHHTLRPLTMAELCDDRPFPDCPTWVPIWSRPRKTIRLYYEQFNASLGTNVRLEPGPPGTLCAAGYILDSVGHTTGELVNANVSDFDGVEDRWHYPPRAEDQFFVTSAWQLVQQVLGCSKDGHTSKYSINTNNTNTNLNLNTATNTDTKTPNNGDKRSDPTTTTPHLQPPYSSDLHTTEAFIRTLVGNQISTSHKSRAETTEEVTRSAYAWLRKHVSGFPRPTTLLQRTISVLEETFYPGVELSFQVGMLRTCFGRRFFVTRGGYLGVGPGAMRDGDEVAVLLGLSVPVLVRPVEKSGEERRYELVGECYVHGIMDGELVKAQMEKGREAEILRLV